MDYKLAKKLKEAGFPQQVGVNMPHCRGYYNTGENGEFDVFKMSGSAYFPTLSELIKECGDRFRWLKHNIHQKDKLFLAQAKNAKKEIKVKEIKCFGETPEEAMVNLWIELNKK